MEPQNPSDLTPESGGPTDVTPVGREVPTPPHEQPASTHPGAWQAIAALPEFRELLKAKLRFIVPATIFFTVYYFALLIVVGWYPEVAKIKVWGEANLGYFFSLSQFFMAWILAAIYVFVAAGWDKRAAALIDHVTKRPTGGAAR